MILSAKQAESAANCRKITHRIPVADPKAWRRSRMIGRERRFYGPEQVSIPKIPHVGERIPVSKAGQPSMWFEVLSITEAVELGELTRQEANAEGYGGVRGSLLFRDAWLERYDRAWMTKRKAALDAATMDHGALLAAEHIWDLATRYRDRHAATLIHVITWQACEAPDIYLADTRRGQDYTANPGRAIDLAPVPPRAFVDAEARRADEAGVKQRASFAAALAAERAQRKADRGRSFRHAA